jgi:hypothetical protein
LVTLPDLTHPGSVGLEAVLELAAVREELAHGALRTGWLECELRANQVAMMQGQGWKDKFERFSELVRKNVSLRNRNQLLVETVVNPAAKRDNTASGIGEVGWPLPGSRWQQRDVDYVDRLAGL